MQGLLSDTALWGWLSLLSHVMCLMYNMIYSTHIKLLFAFDAGAVPKCNGLRALRQRRCSLPAVHEGNKTVILSPCTPLSMLATQSKSLLLMPQRALTHH